MCRKVLISLLGKGFQWMCLFMMVLGLFLSAVPVYADENDDCAAQPRPAQSPPRPGYYNPVSLLDRTLFPAPELLLIHASPPLAGAELDFKYMIPDNDTLQGWYEWDQKISFDASVFTMQMNDNRPVSSDSGHITAYTREQTAYAFFRADGQVEVGLWESMGSSPKSTTLSGSTATDSRSLDVVVGDLDQNLDSNGQFRDEVVVVRTGKSDRSVCYVDVLDSNLTSIASDTISYPDGVKFVAATMGDFNWDGRLELVIALSGDNGTCPIRLLRYTLSNKVLKTCSDQNITSTDGNLDIAAGSFDGSGKDQLVMVHGEYAIYAAIYEIKDGDTDFTATYENYLNGDKSPSACPGDLRVVTGHFDGDPNQGYNMNRRQILVCYAECKNGDDNYNYIDCQIFDATGLTQMTRKHHHQIKHSQDGYYSFRHIDVTAGNFIGHGMWGNAESPLDQFAISFQREYFGGHKTWQDLSIMGFNSNNDLEEISRMEYWNHGIAFELTKYYYWSTVAAPDNTSYKKPAGGAGDWPYPIGDSWLLGPPQHIILDNVRVLNRVLEEPPKHVDYVPKNPADTDSWGDPDAWQVFNISAYGDFNVSFQYQQQTEFDTSNTSTVSKDTGGSQSLDLSADIGIPLAKVSVSYEIQSSYDYESQKENWNKSYSSYTFSTAVETNASDEVTHSMVLFDVWRYPIIGLPSTNTEYPNAVYELVFPSRKISCQQGLSGIADWYQPFHCNHNLLTYPVSDQANSQYYTPDDIGSYDWSNDNGSGKNNAAINDPSKFVSYDQNSQAQTVSWANSSEQGASRSYNNTLSSSTTITAGISSETPYGGASVSASFNFHKSTSMGGAQTASQTDSSSTGITLNIPSQSLRITDAAYTFNPIVYIADAGTLKVTHGVDLTTGSNVGWYAQVYGHSYDLGLNLPNRFNSSLDDNGILVWNDLNTDLGESRMEMVGCFLRSNKPNSLTNTYDFLGEAITAGTAVRLCARVYNLSLNQKITQPFNVKFEYALINTSDNTIPGKRQTIGTTTVSTPPNPRDLTEVYVVWTPAANIAGQAYRFYVTVDPENQLPDEIHEWKETRQEYIGKEGWSDKQGRIYSGNNEGYWPWNGGVTVNAPDSVHPAPHDVHLKPDSLSVIVDGALQNQSGVTLKKGVTYKLRTEVFFSGPSLKYTDVFFYDRNPEETDQAIANPIIVGNSGTEGYAWAEWTPSETGSYTLYARVIEPHNDTNPGNHTATLKVTVQDATPSGGSSGGGSGGCFIGSLMQEGGM